MALILSLGLNAEAKKVKLQYQLKAGDQFKLEKSMTQESIQEFNGQSQTNIFSTSMAYQFKVAGVTPEGEFLMNTALVSFSMSAGTAMGDMKYNSETDSVAPDYAQSMAVQLNEYYSFNLSPLGRISGTKVPEGLAEKVAKALEGIGGAQMQMISAAAGVSPEGFAKSMEGFILEFPEGGADVKKPWKVESKTSQMISFNTITNYELVKSSKEANEIRIDVQMIQDPDSPPMEMQGMTITYELVGAKAGNVLLDPLTGLTLSSESTSNISGTLLIDGPGLPSPMSIPMISKVTEKLVRK